MNGPEAEDTSARIVDLVEALIMERGFNAMSYQDVSDAIGIRKASVHYHFPSKATLGVAVVRRYLAKFETAATPLDHLDRSNIASSFEGFLDMFAEVARQKRVCLGGVLGAEYETLPEAMKTEVRLFYTSAQGWLGGLLTAGLQTRVMDFTGDAAVRAAAILSLLEGALIIARALEDPAVFQAALGQAHDIAGLGMAGGV